MTGFGRTGRWFACDHWAVRPDILVLAKGAASGYWPLGLAVASGAVHDTIDLMIKVFPIRTCSDSSYKKAMASGRPCFPGQIGRCGGPCSMKVTIEEHRAMVEDFIAFMAGGDLVELGCGDRDLG